MGLPVFSMSAVVAGRKSPLPKIRGKQDQNAEYSTYANQEAHNQSGSNLGFFHDIPPFLLVYIPRICLILGRYRRET